MNIVTFQWKKYKDNTTFLPNTLSKYVYDGNYVNQSFENVGKVLSTPFKYFCISDDPTGLSSEINYIPLWDYLKDVGGCARRLYVYTPEMKNLIGDKFFFIDLDFLFVSDFSDLYESDTDLKLFEQFNPENPKKYPRRFHPTGVVKAGSAEELYTSFIEKDPVEQLKYSRNHFTGSDQSWINYYIRTLKQNSFSVSSMGTANGVYNFRMDIAPKGKHLPLDAKIIDFAGPRDPRDFTEQYTWIKDFL